MTAADIRDILNHISMFGEVAVVRRLGSRWTVAFRGFGHPGTFKTKTAALEYARQWGAALRERQRAAA